MQVSVVQFRPWAPTLRSPPFFSVRAPPPRHHNPRKIRPFGLHFRLVRFAPIRAHPGSLGTSWVHWKGRVHWTGYLGGSVPVRESNSRRPQTKSKASHSEHAGPHHHA